MKALLKKSLLCARTILWAEMLQVPCSVAKTTVTSDIVFESKYLDQISKSLHSNVASHCTYSDTSPIGFAIACCCLYAVVVNVVQASEVIVWVSNAGL